MKALAAFAAFLLWRAAVLQLQQQLIAVQSNPALPQAQKEVLQQSLLTQLQQARMALSQANIGSIGLGTTLPSTASANAAVCLPSMLFSALMV